MDAPSLLDLDAPAARRRLARLRELAERARHAADYLDPGPYGDAARLGRWLAADLRAERLDRAHGRLRRAVVTAEVRGGG